jgi:hypothetical protein
LRKLRLPQGYKPKYDAPRANPAGDIATVVGGGTQSDLNAGASLNVSLSYPTGLITDAAGNLYFADAANNVILRVNKGN